MTVVLQRQVRPIQTVQKAVEFSAEPRSQLSGRHGCGQEFKSAFLVYKTGVLAHSNAWDEACPWRPCHWLRHFSCSRQVTPLQLVTA